MSSISTEYQLKRNEGLYEFSDRVVTLSTAALALSVTFRNSIIVQQTSGVWLLKTAWIAFALAALTGIIWRLSKVVVHDAIAGAFDSGASRVRVSPGCFYHLCLAGCLFGFVVGIVAFTVFGFLNIS
jgi:hypothetical protein